MNARKIFLLILVLMECFALSGQLILQVQSGRAEILELLVRFMSYFTILTNILVALYAIALLIFPASNNKAALFRPSIQTAITLYILVVGVVYNLILRQLWSPTGLQAVIDELLHVVAPIMVLIYWWLWVDARHLILVNLQRWLIYPAVYAVVVVMRGQFARWFPYPFLDSYQLGFGRVLINTVGMVLLFLLLGIGLLFAGRKKAHVA